MPDDASRLGLGELAKMALTNPKRMSEAVTQPPVLAVLRALATMARLSRRQEADVASALRGAGLALEALERDAVLRELLDAECIERVIPLIDGGILVSVTAIGIARAAASG